MLSRRGFLGLLGLGAAGVAADQLIEPVRKLWFVPSNAPVGSRIERPEFIVQELKPPGELNLGWYGGHGQPHHLLGAAESIGWKANGVLGCTPADALERALSQLSMPKSRVGRQWAIAELIDAGVLSEQAALELMA